MYRIGKYLLLTVGLVCVVLILTSLLALSSVFLNYAESVSGESLYRVPVPSQFPVNLFPDGFNPSNIKSIDITSNSDKTVFDSTNVKLYRGPCNSHQYTMQLLPYVTRNIKPLGDSRLALNYNYGDWPIYVAGGDSNLVYNISASNGPNHHSDGSCAAELFVFKNQSNYFEFMETTYLPEKGYIKRSGCLPVGSGDETENSTTVFHLPNPNSYFVSISLKKGIEVLVNISVDALEYNITSTSTLVDCALNEYVNKCTISFGSAKLFHQPSSGTVCVWAQAEAYTMLNISSNLNNGNEFVYIAFIVGSIVSIFLFIATFVLFMVGHQLIIMRRHDDHLRQPLLQQKVNCEAYHGNQDYHIQ